MGRLLERETELEVIGELLASAAAGRGLLGLIEGPPGIGKTSLVEAAAEVAAGAGALVLSARGDELEREFGFGVVRQLFEAEAGRRPELLDGPARPAAVALGLGDEPGLPTPDTLFQALHGLYRLTAALATERPLLLLLDDAHLADDASLRFLAYLERRLGDLAVAAIAATRPGRDLSERPVLAKLEAAPSTRLLRPRPLGRVAVAAVVRERLGRKGDEEFVAAAADATGGNPFLLRELLREVDLRRLPPAAASAEEVGAMGPESISRSLLSRLDRLPAGARELATAVAVLGRDEERRFAPALAGIPDEQAAEWADALAELDVLAPGEALAFTHPIARRAVYGALAPGARGQAHARAAKVMHERGATAESVAAHLMLVPPTASDWVVERLRQAAALVAGRGAPGAAAVFLERALCERAPGVPPAVLTGELAQVRALAGDPAAVDTFRAALDQETDPTRRTALGLALARLLFFGGRLEETNEVLLDAAHAGTDDRELRLQLAAELMATARMLPGEPPPLPPSLRFDPDELEGATRGERALLVGLALESVQLARPSARAVELADRTLSDGRILHEEGAASPTYLNAVMVLVLSDELDSGERWLARGDTETRRRGDVAGQAAVTAFRSSAALRRGDVRQAVDLAREAVEGVATQELPVVAVVVATYAVDALIEVGELEEASATLARLGLDGELPDVFHFAAILSRRGRLRAARGMAEEGLADLLEAGRRLTRGRSTNPTFSRWRSHAATVLAGLGRMDEARALADEELELARATRQASSIGVALRTVARLREPADAVDVLREAVDWLARSPDRLQEAHALVDLGAALRRSGQRVEARDPLGRGREIAVASGAVALAERAREELLTAGARPRRVALSGAEALTPSEARCARMAASGMANREIAHALFVSVRAVETHLTSAYRKLGIGSRRELARALETGD